MVRTAKGICAACIHASNCTYPADPQHPPLECAEFELACRPVETANFDPHADGDSSADPYDGFKGLCANCDERATCVYPKPAGGVWRCEEYR